MTSDTTLEHQKNIIRKARDRAGSVMVATTKRITGGPGIDTVDGGAGGDRLFTSLADAVFSDPADVLAPDVSDLA